MKGLIDPNLADSIVRIIIEHKPRTVNQLVLLVNDKFPNLSKEDILNAITQLQSKDKLKFIPAQPRTLSAFLQTSRAAWYWITLVCTITFAAAVFLIAPDPGPLVPVRSVLGIIFLLWFPGYTLTRTLFPPRIRVDIDIVERVALSIAMSLALIPIVGLLLNYTPWGITLTPIVFCLAILTLLLATTALLIEKQKLKTQ